MRDAVTLLMSGPAAGIKKEAHGTARGTVEGGSVSEHRETPTRASHFSMPLQSRAEIRSGSSFKGCVPFSFAPRCGSLLGGLANKAKKHAGRGHNAAASARCVDSVAWIRNA